MEKWHITESCGYVLSGQKSDRRSLIVLFYQKGGVSDSMDTRYCKRTEAVLRGLLEWITTATLPYLHPRKTCSTHTGCVNVSLQHFIQGILRKPNDLQPKKAEILHNMKWFTETDQSQHGILLCTEGCERQCRVKI